MTGSSLVVAATAMWCEALFGYPDRLFRLVGHPVTWIGALIARLDAAWNREDTSALRRRACGVLAIGVVLLIVGAASFALRAATLAILPPLAASVVLGLLASGCIAQRSLHRHVAAVATALEGGSSESLTEARRAVAMIVGRDTGTLDEAGIARAAIESLAENFGDGIVLPAIFIALGGLPGGLLAKAVNTADSMVGHRTARHQAFGYASAKLDDLVAFPAARLAALLIVAAAFASSETSGRGAWRVMRRDARGHASPNAGWPEAAMAGALGITLGGSRAYAGRVVVDATMGDGVALVGAPTIRAALRVYHLACGLQLAVVTASMATVLVVG